MKYCVGLSCYLVHNGILIYRLTGMDMLWCKLMIERKLLCSVDFDYF